MYPQMVTFTAKLRLQGPMDVRDTYYEGRPEALTLHHRFKSREKDYCLDFNSVYPAILR